MSKFVLTTVQDTGHSGIALEAQETLQPPAHLNMTQPHMKMVWEIITICLGEAACRKFMWIDVGRN